MLEGATVTISLRDFEELKKKAEAYITLEKSTGLTAIVHHKQIAECSDGYKKVIFHLSDIV